MNMKKPTKVELAMAGVIIILAVITSYQTYLYFEVKEDITNINTGLVTHGTEINNINSELTGLKSQTQQQLGIINEELETSSENIIDLKEDISDIQIRSKDFSSIVEEVLPAVVSVITDKSQGSGAIISENGYIVTNYHVIEGASRVKILTYNNKNYAAQVIGFSRNTDVALLKIEENNLQFLDFGDSDEVKVGEHVIALGNPLGLSFTVTEGIISATEREGPNGLKAYIQIDVPINPGNSGGPLVNIKKEIIGITNFKIGGFESLGFAIDSDHIKEVVDEIFDELERRQS